jgi:mannose-6-phosphate isomerase-like protein (cupin superfamily)
MAQDLSGAAGRAKSSTCERDCAHYAGPVSDIEPRRVEKPWGHELWWAQTDEYAGKILQVEAGHELSLQVHRRKDETSYLLRGRLRLSRGPSAEELETREVGPGFAWRVEPGTVHTIAALEDSTVLEVSTPHLDDVVRLRDRYQRA